jgi:hypothetical protein
MNCEFHFGAWNAPYTHSTTIQQGGFSPLSSCHPAKRGNGLKPVVESIGQ